MNVVLAVKNYVAKMIEDSGPGMKAFIMDKETISIVSMVFAQSEILQKEVYLFENIETMKGEGVKQVKALVFVRPTEDNIQMLSDELKKPRFGKYYLNFSNTVSKSDVKILAESDEQECVCDVHEYFADYYPLDSHHFTFNMPNCAYHFTWNQLQLARCCQGLMATALSMKKKPTVIRYAASSAMCKRLAEGLSHQISRQVALFDFNNHHRSDSSSMMLLIVDRRDDPVTPLLNQWTYEAMTHELFGIANGRVNLSNSGSSNLNTDLKEVVLSPLSDQFYRENSGKNFGEIGVSIKQLMEEFQQKTKQQQQIQSIDDMKNFVENYPQFKKMSGNVTKHVTLVSELSRIVNERNLLEVSEIEQDICCQNDQSDVEQRAAAMMKHQKVTSHEALRLAVLYGLRYGGANNRMVERANHKDGRRIMSALTRYNQAKLGNEDSKARSITKRFFKELKGVENVYTQHKPSVVKTLLERVLDGRWRSDYPAAAGSTGVEAQIHHVVLFIVGGSTYEEKAYVEAFNRANPSYSVVLGGTCVHNSHSFIEEVMFACGTSAP